MPAHLISAAASRPGASGDFLSRKHALKQDAIVALILITVCFSPYINAQPPSQPAPQEKRHVERRQIEQLEEKWRQAILHSDVAALDSVLDEDYVAITAAGMLRTKEQTLTALRTGKLHIASLDLTDRKYRFYGKTALVNGRAEAIGTTSEGDMTGNYRYTQVYVYTLKSGWKMASFEINRIREPKEHHEGEIIGFLHSR